MYEKLKSLRKSAKSGTTNLINYLLIFNHRRHTNFQIWTQRVRIRSTHLLSHREIPLQLFTKTSFPGSRRDIMLKGHSSRKQTTPTMLTS